MEFIETKQTKFYEIHRFAKHYHHILRSKSVLNKKPF